MWIQGRRLVLAAAGGAIAALLPAGAAACLNSASSCPDIGSALPRVVDERHLPAVVSLYGTGLNRITSVLLEPRDVPVAFRVISPQEIDVTVPARTAPGDHWVIVSGPDGASSADPPPMFRVAIPVDPTAAPAQGPVVSLAPPPVAVVTPEPTPAPVPTPRPSASIAAAAPAQPGLTGARIGLVVAGAGTGFAVLAILGAGAYLAVRRALRARRLRPAAPGAAPAEDIIKSRMRRI